MSINIKSVWEELKQRAEACRECEFCNTRAKVVFGEGPIDSKVVIVGEAPGKQENLQGRPFIGPAGDLLTKILQNGGGIKRETVYITNIVKCWPPPEENEKDKSNGKPKPINISKCIKFLEAQLLLLRPKIIVTMGNIPTQNLLKTTVGITQLRGNWREWRGIKLFPMLHPSFLLRQLNEQKQNELKRETWQDVLSLREQIIELGLDKEMLFNDKQQKNPDTPGDNSRR